MIKLKYPQLLPYIFGIMVILFIIITSIFVSKVVFLETKPKRITILALSVIYCTTLIFLGASGFWLFQKSSLSGSEIEKFSYNFEQLTNNYYKELDKKELLSKAFDTVLNEINDPYTTRISERFINMLENDSKKLMVSLYYNTDNDIFISSIVEESDASNENIKVNDKVLSINGISMIR